MELKEAQQRSFEIVSGWNKKNSKEHNPQTVFPHLIEEVGELAKELNHFVDDWRDSPNKEKLAKEMADIFIQLSILATDNNIDLDKAIIEKIDELNKRFDLK